VKYEIKTNYCALEPAGSFLLHASNMVWVYGV